MHGGQIQVGPLAESLAEGGENLEVDGLGRLLAPFPIVGAAPVEAEGPAAVALPRLGPRVAMAPVGRQRNPGAGPVIDAGRDVEAETSKAVGPGERRADDLLVMVPLRINSGRQGLGQAPQVERREADAAVEGVHPCAVRGDEPQVRRPRAFALAQQPAIEIVVELEDLGAPGIVGRHHADVVGPGRQGKVFQAIAVGGQAQGLAAYPVDVDIDGRWALENELAAAGGRDDARRIETQIVIDAESQHRASPLPADDALDQIAGLQGLQGLDLAADETHVAALRLEARGEVEEAAVFEDHPVELYGAVELHARTQRGCQVVVSRAGEHVHVGAERGGLDPLGRVFHASRPAAADGYGFAQLHRHRELELERRVVEMRREAGVGDLGEAQETVPGAGVESLEDRRGDEFGDRVEKCLAVDGRFRRVPIEGELGLAEPDVVEDDGHGDRRGKHLRAAAEDLLEETVGVLGLRRRRQGHGQRNGEHHQRAFRRVHGSALRYAPAPR